MFSDCSLITLDASAPMTLRAVFGSFAAGRHNIVKNGLRNAGRLHPDVHSGQPFAAHPAGKIMGRIHAADNENQIMRYPRSCLGKMLEFTVVCTIGAGTTLPLHSRCLHPLRTPRRPSRRIQAATRVSTSPGLRATCWVRLPAATRKSSARLRNVLVSVPPREFPPCPPLACASMRS